MIRGWATIIALVEISLNEAADRAGIQYLLPDKTIFGV